MKHHEAIRLRAIKAGLARCVTLPLPETVVDHLSSPFESRLEAPEWHETVRPHKPALQILEPLRR